jgi:hypothetical protein
MDITYRALITELHGMLFGAFFILALFGLLVLLYRSVFETQPAVVTPRGRCLEQIYLIGLPVFGWLAVLSGAYIVYPWYRAVPPAGTVLTSTNFPRYFLLSNAATAGWHNIGMEWKEYVAWYAVIAATMLAYVLIRYGSAIHLHAEMRTIVITFATVAFLTAGIAGALGALINKAAPVEGGNIIHMTGGAK